MLTARQKKYLAKISSFVEAIIAESEKAATNAHTEVASGRKRRSAAEAAKMRREILVARNKGVPAVKLAEKYGVSSAYIYMIKE